MNDSGFSKRIAEAFLSGVGGALIIGLLYFLQSGDVSFTVFIAPFASSAVLVIIVPAAPFSQPRNVLGGHMLAALIGVAVYSSFATTEWWSISLAVGLAMFFMIVLKTMHPPAGATAVLPILSKITDFTWAFSPVLAGAVITVLVGVAYNRLVRKHRY